MADPQTDNQSAPYLQDLPSVAELSNMDVQESTRSMGQVERLVGDLLTQRGTRFVKVSQLHCPTQWRISKLHDTNPSLFFKGTLESMRHPGVHAFTCSLVPVEPA